MYVLDLMPIRAKTGSFEVSSAIPAMLLFTFNSVLFAVGPPRSVGPHRQVLGPSENFRSEIDVQADIITRLQKNKRAR